MNIINKLKVLPLAILAAALFVGTSLADETMMGKDTSTMMGKDATTMMERGTYAPKELIGLFVNDRDGKHVGVIRDVRVNAANGEVNYVVVGKSLLGIGETEYAVPLEGLKIERADRTAILTVPVNKLLTVPSIVAGESDEEYKVLLQEHYGIAPEFGEGNGGPGKMMHEEKGGYREKSGY
jgi:sporulation protein YlmC with PRC-barrel domain